jgi:pimeloyl-ACP methyl ester carboxylesterase
MRIISLLEPETDVWLAAKDGQKYIPLGSARASQIAQPTRDRLERRSAGPVRDVWATLGPWDENSPAGWMGELQVSSNGSTWSNPANSGADTVELIGTVRRSTALIEGGRVREQFVDLSRLRFAPKDPGTFTLGEGPALRLTLLLQPDEGAVVCLQYGAMGEDGIEFISPESTGPAHSCSQRDRLHYRIPLWLVHGLSSAEQTNSGDLALRMPQNQGGMPPNTVLKVLTFQRENSTSHQVIRRALVRLGRDKHNLWRWNLRHGGWESVSPDKVKRDAKTLLFLHGTFSSTNGSFGELAEERQWSFLQNISLAKRRYGQVLALDHDTVLETLSENTERLKAAVGGAFQQPIDIVSHSRGGLLAKHLALRCPGIEVERVALIACANGVGYMRAIANIARFLSVMRRLLRFTGAGDIVGALVQHSVEMISELPGLKVMTPGDAELKALMNAPISAGRCKTVFFPIIGDYDRGLAKDERFFKRMALNGLDLLIKAFLGKQHDWVVGAAAQAIVAPGHLGPFVLETPIQTWHTDYFRRPETQRAINEFLLR